MPGQLDSQVAGVLCLSSGGLTEYLWIPFSRTSWTLTSSKWLKRFCSCKYSDFWIYPKSITRVSTWPNLIPTFCYDLICPENFYTKSFLLATTESAPYPVSPLPSPTCSQPSQCEWWLWATSCFSNPTLWQCGRRSRKPRCHPPWRLPKSPCCKRRTQERKEGRCQTEHVVLCLVYSGWN